MTSKLPVASLLILAACSGSSGSPILDSPEPANTFVTHPPAPPTPPLTKSVVPEDSGTPVEASTDGGQDSGLDASDDASQGDSGAQDASLEASVDAGVDAADAAVVPRYGVTFDGTSGSALSAPLPIGVIGKSELTFEAWFRLNAASDRGLIFNAQNTMCAVTTTGPQTGTIHCCNQQGGVGQSCVTGAALASFGVWKHVAWVLSSGSWTLFVDGVKQGDVPSAFNVHPNVYEGTPVRFGVETWETGSVVGTIDEFRLSYAALYTANFTPPKHLDAPGALNLLLDEGTGTTSGPATLLGTASWITVSR